MRDIIEVIDRIIAEIPPDEALRDQYEVDLMKRFKGQLEIVKQRSKYRAPEQQGIDWSNLAGVLAHYLPRPVWKQSIADIFEGKL
jgi:hypothetical protein